MLTTQLDLLDYMEITFAQEKAFNALVYFTQRIKPLYLTKAIKLLYIADEKAIKETGVPITLLNYKAWKYGPVPEDIYNKIKLAHNHQKVGSQEANIDQVIVSSPPEHLPEGCILEARKEFDDSQFSDYEIEVLDAVIDEYGKYNGEQLVEVLHEEGSLWHKTVDKNNLQGQFALKSNRSDFVIEFTELLDSDYKKSAFEVAYQSYLMQANLI